jgi:predicted acylesterase/phospholipase RssA
MNASIGRRGLVLQGGGAKGAFTFGALLALADYDIHTDAVSGTSAGALNACLWGASNRALALNEGWTIWTELRFRDVIKANRKHWIIIVFMLPVILLKFYGHEATKDQPTRPRWTVLLWISLFLFFWHADGSVWEACLIAVYITFILRPVFAGESSARIAGLVQWFYFAVIGALSFVCDRIFGTDFVTSLVIAHPKTYTIAYCVPLAFLVVYKLNFNALDMTPLKHTVERILKSDPAIPIYITMTERIELFDPDNIKYRLSDVPTMAPYAARTTHDCPIYVPLHEQPLNLRTANVMASAALPFGIVKSPTVNGKTVVDGGVADNIPLFPLVELFPCESVVIVGLQPTWDGFTDYVDLRILREKWKRTDRLIRLAKERFDAFSDDGRPWFGNRNFPEREPSSFPQRLIPITPDKGFPLLGTFLFTRRFTRRWVEEGYLRAHIQLRIAGFTRTSSAWEDTIKNAKWSKNLIY